MTPEMIAALTALAAQVQAWMAGGGLVFARIGPVFALVPVLGERSVPARIRLVAALAMTLVVAPAVAPRIPLPAPDPFGLVLFLGGETLVGLILGLSLRLMILALMMAGTKAAQATSLAQAFGGAGVDPQPAMAQLLVMAGLCVAAMSGIPERLAQLLVLSYDLFPAGIWPSPEAVAQWGVDRVSRAFALSFSLAAPFVTALDLPPAFYEATVAPISGAAGGDPGLGDHPEQGRHPVDAGTAVRHRCRDRTAPLRPQQAQCLLDAVAFDQDAVGQHRTQAAAARQCGADPVGPLPPGGIGDQGDAGGRVEFGEHADQDQGLVGLRGAGGAAQGIAVPERAAEQVPARQRFRRRHQVGGAGRVGGAGLFARGGPGQRGRQQAHRQPGAGKRQPGERQQGRPGPMTSAVECDHAGHAFRSPSAGREGGA